jgi:hypothetical protein
MRSNYDSLGHEKGIKINLSLNGKSIDWQQLLSGFVFHTVLHIKEKENSRAEAPSSETSL